MKDEVGRRRAKGYQGLLESWAGVLGTVNLGDSGIFRNSIDCLWLRPR